MPKSENVVLEVKDLRQHFRVGSGKRRINVKAVDGVSFNVHEGEVFGLVGESGCGKTTTGRSIIKLYRPTDGVVKYEGKVIGAGYSGNVRNIKRLRKEAKLEIIKQDQYKYERHLINEKYCLLIKDKNKDLQDRKSQYKVELQDIKSINEHIRTEILSVKSLFNLRISELEHDKIKEVDLLKASIQKQIDHKYKITLEAADKRLYLKTSYLPEANLTKEEKVEQYDIFEAEYYKELVTIQNEYLKKLDKHNPSKYIKVAKKIYTSRVKNAKHYTEVIVNHAVEKIESLESYVVPTVQENDRDKRLREAIKVERKFRNDAALLKDEEVKEIITLKKQLKTKEELAPQYQAIKDSFKIDSDLIKADLNNIKTKKQNELLALKEQRTQNPEKFTVNKEVQKEIKAKLRIDVRSETSEIKKLRQLNKISETKEEKEIRINVVNELTKEYESKSEKYKTEISDLKLKLTENSNDEELTEKLHNLEEEFKKYGIETRLEIKKASIKNSYSGVMSQLQMIFQDPVSSLNPRKTVKEIISEGLIIQGIKDHDYINEKVANSLKLVGLAPEHASRYPHEFSGGQRQRIGIARALIVNPKFIIADEPISALDVSIQAQIINLLKDLKDELGLTILFIAHDLSVVKYFSDRIAVMYFGKIVEQTTAAELFKNPLHPYTKSLLSAIPQPDPISERTRTRTTYNPSIHNYANDKPSMVEIKPGHFIYANNEEIVQYKKELAKGVEL